MIIGLTGSSGAGKSSAAEFFRQNGFVIIDYDKLSHEIYRKGEPCLKELTEHFGDDIIDGCGNVIRKKLGDIVFTDKQKLNLLNSITMKHILAKSEILIEQNKSKNIVLDAPLLYEANLDKICDVTIAVISDMDIQIKRMCERDGVSERTARGRLSSQHTNEFFIQNANYCIRNDKTPTDLELSLKNLLEILYDIYK